jgi:crotonobetainyl-CoA:carnitine CoA-transferase CaiB-like acyl-CoA transferase
LPTVEPLRPLTGIVVVNLGINLPAPAAGARLTELGADVVKVEPPDGDPLWHNAPEWYGRLTAGQAVERLDLKDAAGRARLDGHLEGADVLLTSSRPAALERLGLGWPAVGGRFPRLVQVAIVGYPRPRQDVPGHDLTYLAHLGLLSPPALPRTLMADIAGSERAVSATAGLLLARERGGGPRYAEVALSDAAAAFAGPWESGLTGPGGMVGGGLAAYGFYEAEGGWVALAAIEPHFQRRLCEELGIPRVDRDALARAFRSRTPAEWEEWADARGLPLAAVAGDGGGA